ncbi:heat shock protein Hsp18 [Alkaliphilus crotonatoxidans]
MFDMMPFRRNQLNRRDDFFSPFKSFFDDDLITAMNQFHGNFKVDLKETEDHYLIEAELPGINRDAIDIDFNNNYLTISAKREEAKEDQKENYVRRERHYGEFKRSFYVDNVDEDKINANFQDGILTITLPKLTKGETRRRKIDIN